MTLRWSGNYPKELGDGTNFSYGKRKNQQTMNLLTIFLCFVLAYGVFALLAFKIVKVMFPDTHHEEKRWKIKSPEM